MFTRASRYIPKIFSVFATVFFADDACFCLPCGSGKPSPDGDGPYPAEGGAPGANEVRCFALTLRHGEAYCSQAKTLAAYCTMNREVRSALERDSGRRALCFYSPVIIFSYSPVCGWVRPPFLNCCMLWRWELRSPSEAGLNGKRW